MAKAKAPPRWMSVEKWKASAEALRELSEDALVVRLGMIESRLQALHEDERGNLRDLNRWQEDEFYFLLWARDWARAKLHVGRRRVRF